MLLHLGPNIITFRTSSHLGQFLHLGPQQGQSGIGTWKGYVSLSASMVFIKVFCFGSQSVDQTDGRSLVHTMFSLRHWLQGRRSGFQSV